MLLALSAAVVTLGAPVGWTFLLLFVIAVLVSLRDPDFGFYVSIATAPLLGLSVSISTGALQFGERAFGGSIDVTLGEVIVSAVIAAWALRMITLWRTSHGSSWKPWLPLAAPFFFLVAAHALSFLSPASPDPILVFKYSLRPVLFVYLTSIALPANFIRGKRQLMASLFILGSLGLLFALDGFRSLFVPISQETLLPHARPLPMLGFEPIGDNHNILAELLLVTAPATLALREFLRDFRRRAVCAVSAAFMAAIALFTFARSAWIVLVIQLAVLFATSWKTWFKQQKASILLLALAALPFIVYMVVFSLRPGVQSSTDARAMLSGVAFDAFRQSPWFGVGAGQFVDHVAKTYAYTVEFGTPMDSHGLIQKVMAEAGAFGLLALAVLLIALARRILPPFRSLRFGTPEARAYTFLVIGVLGAFAYQLFNTTYWTPKLWLPVGIALAAGRLFTEDLKRSAPDFLPKP